MRNTNFFRIFISAFVLIAVSLSSCKKDETLSLTPANNTLTKDAGSFTINVTSNASWTVISDQTWCVIGATSGEENGAITVSYQENTTETSRTASITVSTKDGLLKVVSISQAGIPPVANPFIGKWKYEPTGDGSYEEFTFGADMKYQLFEYDGSDGSSLVDKGVYDYAERTSVLTLTFEDELFAVSYKFIDSDKLLIDDDTYFKQ